MIIAFLVIVNSVILEALYYYSKKESSIETYEYVKQNLNNEVNEVYDSIKELYLMYREEMDTNIKELESIADQRKELEAYISYLREGKKEGRSFCLFPSFYQLQLLLLSYCNL